MNSKTACATLAGILIVLSAVLFLGQSPVFAESCQIVRIASEKGAAGTRLEVNPQNMTVTTDTCVVWMNWVPTDPVTVSFTENAKQCDLSTEATGFNLKEGEECYFAELLTRGKTASMYFNEPGVYKYQLEIPPKSGGTMGPTPSRIVVNGVIEVVKAK